MGTETSGRCTFESKARSVLALGRPEKQVAAAGWIEKIKGSSLCGTGLHQSLSLCLGKYFKSHEQLDAEGIVLQSFGVGGDRVGS